MSSPKTVMLCSSPAANTTENSPAGRASVMLLSAASSPCSSTLPCASTTRIATPAAEEPSEKPPSQVMVASPLSKQSNNGECACTGKQKHQVKSASGGILIKRNVNILCTVQLPQISHRFMVAQAFGQYNATVSPLCSRTVNLTLTGSG